MSFQQGVNDYTNAVDTNLRQASPDVNYATEETIWSDANDAGNTNSTQFLLRFDNIIGTGTNQIPAGCFDPLRVRRNCRALPLIPWATAGVSTPCSSRGVTPPPLGIPGATASSRTALKRRSHPRRWWVRDSGFWIPGRCKARVNAIEVTADVQAWVNGTMQNNGWAMLPWPGGKLGNGWGSRSSEYTSLVDPLNPAQAHPRLRVAFTAGALAVPAVIQKPT